KKHDGGKFEETIKAEDVVIDAIPQLWAKSYITYLEDKFRSGLGDRTKLKEEIVAIAKAHSLLTKFTAFVLVDEKEIVNQTGKTRTVVQPVCEPDAWEMQQDAGNAPRQRSSLMGQMVRQQQVSAYRNIQMDDADRLSGGAGGGWGSAPSSTSWSAPASNQPTAPAPSAMPMSGAPTFASQAPSPPSQAGKGGSPPDSRLKSQGPTNTYGSLPPSQPPPSEEQPLTLAESIKRKLFGQGPSVPDNKLTKAIRDLHHALEDVWAAISEGRTPPADALAQAREAVLQALVDDTNASELPTLQRFLRVDAMELVAALNSSATTANDLTRLSGSSKTAFDAVKNELQSKFKLNASSGASTPFWEDSI
ncbi:MAG: hypothetical protein ACRD3W_21265, partial [Terriglobales bacterium]